MSGGAESSPERNFYPRPPRGGRHLAELQNIMMRGISSPALREEGDEAHCGSAKLLQAISIHALREEGDERICVHSSESGNFYPRPPRGGRRHDRQLPPHHQEISIHALREEGDTSNRDTLTWVAYFYPRPPRGGRPTAGGLDLLGQGFLSTPSARRATLYLPVAGQLLPYFYPRPPRGGRHGSPIVWIVADKFLSTPSARRAT